MSSSRLFEAERLLAAALTGHEHAPNGAHLRRGELADIEIALALVREELQAAKIEARRVEDEVNGLVDAWKAENGV